MESGIERLADAVDAAVCVDGPIQGIADALRDGLLCAGEDYDQTLIGAVADLATNAKQIATAITAQAAPGMDESGGTITSLTESVMGMTSGLYAIAHSIEMLADVVREKGHS